VIRVNGKAFRTSGNLESAGPYRAEREFHIYTCVKIRYCCFGKDLLTATRRTLISESDTRLRQSTFGTGKASDFDAEFSTATGCEWIRPDVWGNEPY